ncbi:hypothetical protein HAX54_016985 [Datura stramonium]|uniref:15-cis-phytoene synthase n=1 Tax=Datura stramonium TaxID=4076 RepID=A0ABS8UJU4_DATST|nr:hypothetical protein [Datura stramonium]
MKKQIQRARKFFDEAEKGVTELSSASRWPVLASLLLYRKILDEIRQATTATSQEGLCEQAKEASHVAHCLCKISYAP